MPSNNTPTPRPAISRRPVSAMERRTYPLQPLVPKSPSHPDPSTESSCGRSLIAEHKQVTGKGLQPDDVLGHHLQPVKDRRMSHATVHRYTLIAPGSSASLALHHRPAPDRRVRCIDSLLMRNRPSSPSTNSMPQSAGRTGRRPGRSSPLRGRRPPVDGHAAAAFLQSAPPPIKLTFLQLPLLAERPDRGPASRCSRITFRQYRTFSASCLLPSDFSSARAHKRRLTDCTKGVMTRDFNVRRWFAGRLRKTDIPSTSAAGRTPGPRSRHRACLADYVSPVPHLLRVLLAAHPISSSARCAQTTAHRLHKGV